MNQQKQDKLNNRLIEAAKNGDKEKVIDLLNQGAYIHADNDGRENAVLYLAARYGHKEMVELLLDRGADVHARDDMALSWAATNGHKEVVELLLDRGADIHANNDAALRTAASTGHTEVVELLLDRGANIHADNDAALKSAAENDYKEVVELLLDRGADIHADNDLALIYAAAWGNTKTVELLLNRGADVHTQDDLALRCAANYGHPEVVELLKQHIAQEQAIGKTVGEFIKEHPQTTLELMTPDGYVLLNAEIMQRAINERNGKLYPNLGFRGSEHETELNDILSQYINSINPKEDDPNYLYMMTADQFEDIQFETGGKTMKNKVVELLKQHTAKKKAPMQEQAKEQQIKEGEKSMKNKVVEPLKQHTAKEKASEFLNTETVLKKLRAYPSHAYFKAGENQIDAYSEIIEAHYELFEPALSVYENGHLLFSENSVCVGNYHFEPYTVGKFTSLPDTMNYLKEKYAGVEGWEAVDKPVPYVSEDHPRVWKNQAYAEREAMENEENQNKTNEEVKNMEQISNETKNKSETPINPIELKAKSPEGKIIEIGAKVTQGIKDLFDSEKYKEYLQVMSKFHNYSLKNTVLIAMQMPTATKVTNFNTWKFGLGRTVKKGEQGMKIMSPMPVKSKQAIEKLDPQTDKPVLDDAGNPITEEKEITTTAVKVTTVFDVSQTEGKDLENSNTPTKDFYTAVEKVSNVPIDAKDGNDQEKIKEAINEITNTKLQTLQDQSPNAIDEHTREIQAASVAYTVCQHYGLDTSNYSFDNVSEWSNGRKFTELRNTLETIHTAADNIIEDINQNVMAIAKSKEQAQEQEPRPYHEPVNDKLAELKHEQMQEQNKEQKKTYEMER